MTGTGAVPAAALGGTTFGASDVVLALPGVEGETGRDLAGCISPDTITGLRLLRHTEGDTEGLFGECRFLFIEHLLWA